MNQINDFVVPKLRDNIKIDIFEENQQKIYVLSDPLGYAPQPIFIPEFFFKIFEYFDGEKTFNEVLKLIKAYYKFEINLDIVINALKLLNDNCYLESPNYFLNKYQIDAYLLLKNRPPVCVGSSYPAEAIDFELRIEEILNSYKKDGFK